jgi:hypothetical protein
MVADELAPLRVVVAASTSIFWWEIRNLTVFQKRRRWSVGFVDFVLAARENGQIEVVRVQFNRVMHLRSNRVITRAHLGQTAQNRGTRLRFESHDLWK